MTTTRKIGVAIAVLIALFVAWNIYYFMPRATKVTITRTESKVRDQTDRATGENRPRDMGLVYTIEVDGGQARAFRNEDNGWYFKFDSEDIAAEASKFALMGQEQQVLLKYYGVRIPILDLFPNVISLKAVDPDYVYVPWVNMIILVVMLVVFIWLGIKIRKVFRSAKAKITNRPAAS